MQCVTLLLILVDTGLKELYFPLLVTGIHCTMWWVWKHICQYQWSWDKPYSLGCNHLCPYQTLPWNDTIFVVDWDILYKLCGSAKKWSKGFVFSVKIWWLFFSCNKACSKYDTHSTTTPKYTLPQRLVLFWNTSMAAVTSCENALWRAGVGKQRDKNLRGAGERGTGGGRVWPPVPRPKKWIRFFFSLYRDYSISLTLSNASELFWAEFLSAISKFIKRKKILSLHPSQNVKLGIFTW